MFVVRVLRPMLRPLFWIWISAAGFPCVRAAQAWVPASDDIVLVRLSSGGFGGSAPSMAALFRQNRSVSNSVNVAEQVRLLILESRREGDPRPLSRAQSLLEAHSTQVSLPIESVLLRAQVLQGLHVFAEALADVDRILRMDARHAGAWLLKSTIHQVQGDYPAARRACFALARFGDELVAVTAATALAGLRTNSPASLQQLESLVMRRSDAPLETRVWVWTTLGEAWALRGEIREAERCFRSALVLEPSTPYTLGALADLFLDNHRPAEVCAFLNDTQSDSLRLRLAEAEIQLVPRGPRTIRLVRQLREGFALARLREENIHLREHARFLLRIEGSPRQALDLARRNFEIQKEPADLRLLLEAARKSGSMADCSEALAWAQEHQPAVLSALNSSMRDFPLP